MAEALKLMITGMGTVFFILVMVVVLGRLIIKVTNKFEVAPLAQTGSKKVVHSSAIAPSKLAAIVSAVDITTNGKGKVTSVEKMN